jgi:secondary thiamine-phosphate synthase enzyme
MRSTTFSVTTGATLVTDVTDHVESFVRDASGGADGAVNVFVPHATCGVALMETGSGSEQDLADALGRLLPRDDRYRHRHGSVGHGGDHVAPAFVSPSMVIPIERGSLALGTWQRVVLVDPNVDNPIRTVRLTVWA